VEAKVCGGAQLRAYTLAMQAQAVEQDHSKAAKRLRLIDRLTAECRWSSRELEGGEVPSGLPRIVRERVEELLSLGCLRGDALAQAQGERHIRISQRMRVIRHQGPFAFYALSRAASHYPYESLEYEEDGLRQKRLLAYCAYIDCIEAKRAPRFINPRTAAPVAL